MFRFKNIVFTSFLIFFSVLNFSQNQKFPAQVEVMTLGVFHFNFPNNDVKQTKDTEQINVLDKQYQNEINKILKSLKKFNPTKIIVEVNESEEKKFDSLFTAYKNGIHTLGKNEVEQLGFRLAKELKINQLEYVDTWGKLYQSTKSMISDSIRIRKFENYYFNNPDSIYDSPEKNIFTSKGIIADLIERNNPENIKKSLGAYLIGHFKYEENKNDFTGTDFETGRWFNRNLRIFRNIQRIKTQENDRLLVIFGSGHMNILNYLFECSPEYKLVNPIPFLRKARD